MLSDDVKRFEEHSRLYVKNKVAYKVGKLSFILLYALGYDNLSCRDIESSFVKVYGVRYRSKVNSYFIGQSMRYYKQFFDRKYVFYNDRKTLLYIKKKKV